MFKRTSKESRTRVPRYLYLAGILNVFIAPAFASSRDCAVHPLYCAILELRPDISTDFAMDFSNYVSKYSRQYKVDPYRVLAIAMQESAIRNIHRKQMVVLINEQCDDEGVCTEYTSLASGYTDIGIFQFHALTIQYYGMDILRLRDDIEYATEQHCKLLAIKIKECADLGEEAWSCYHSRSPKYRVKYVTDVNRYYLPGGAADGSQELSTSKTAN